MAVSTDPLLTELLRLDDARAWPQAERVCEDILARDPEQPLALVISGEIALARGDELATVRERLRHAARVPIVDLETLLRLVGLVARAGDVEVLRAALGNLEALLRTNPENFHAWFALGQICRALGRIDEAVAAYDRACAIVPANAGPHTFRAILLLRSAWGDPLPAPPDKRQTTSPSGRITMSTLGLNGRFGNQILQYCFLRLYGHVHNLRIELPEWIGRWLLDLDDPYPGDPLPKVTEGPDLIRRALSENAPPLLANHDLWGFCQYHTSFYRQFQALFRTFCRPGARLQPSVDRALTRLRERAQTVVAIHLRRGDYIGGELFWPAPSSWYLAWLTAIWHQLPEPLLYVASDDPSVQREFAAFSPITAADLGETILGAEMYPDFHILAHADVLAISNSSFSMCAAMLNERARSYMRPAPNEHRLVPFDPWNAEVLLNATGSGHAANST
jgi:tetratricopeptide (TPR) repeat protein